MSFTQMSKRFIPSPIYLRMLGYAVTLAMHIINAVHMVNTFKGEILKDPDVERFHDDQYKFLTVWNVYTQMFYSALGLSCDVLSLTNEGKVSSLLKTLKTIRDPLFSGVIFPLSFTVSCVFWTVFSYERSLILPPSVDKTLSWSSNHIIHTAIVAVVLWEIVFRPRSAPETHVPNLVLMCIYTSVYFAVMINSYLTIGIWLYPIMNILDGTAYLYIFFTVTVLLVQAFYCLQWYLTDLVWGSREDMKKLTKSS